MNGGGPRHGGRGFWVLLPFVGAALTTALAGLILYGAYRSQVERRQDAARADIVTQLSTVRARLESVLTQPLLISRGIVAEIVEHGGITDEKFTRLAAILVSDYPTIRNLTLSRGTVITAVYPLASNRAALGFDYHTRPDQWATVERAIASRRPVVAGPVKLVQGGTALIGRVPIFLSPAEGNEPTLFGLISVVIDIPSVFAAAGIDTRSGPFNLAIRGKDGLGAAGAVILGDEAVFTADPVEMDVTLPDGTWQLGAIPWGGWSAEDGEVQVTRFLGGFLWVFVALASFGSAFHVHSQRNARSRIAESEERYRALVETAPVAVAVHRDGIIIFANGEAERMLGVEPGGLVGRKVLDLVHPDFQEIARERISRVFLDGATSPILEQRLVTGNGHVIDVEVSTARVSLNGELAVMSVVRDISLRHQAETERDRLLRNLQRSNDDLQQFAFIASHDLQEPLRNVSGYVQLLARRYGGRLDQDADEFIAFAVQGTKRMQEMITNLLEYSRLHGEAEAATACDSRTVIDGVLADLSVAMVEAGATVEVKPLPRVLVREHELARIFQNLIGNALKYRKPDVAPVIVISARSEGRMRVFSIKDNGIGIEPDYQDKVFTLFQRLHSRGEYAGTGLGLAICRKLVLHNGGRIWVESKPGEGSTFLFTLPAAEG